MIPIKDSVPTRSFPLVTLALIAANLAVWVFYQVPDLDHSVRVLGFYPCEANNACHDPGVAFPWDVLTSMFAHGGWLHVLGNMLFLWIFGNNVEDAMGKVRFLLFYVGAGIAAAALQGLVTLEFGTRLDSMVPNVGASGAIAGVLAAYFVLYPLARVLALVPIFIFFLPVELPALFFLGVWFLFQAWMGGFSLVVPHAGGGVAFFAHIGGFTFGLLVVRLLAVRARPARAAGPPGYRAGPWYRVGSDRPPPFRYR